MTLVSIVIPSFNQVSYLETTLLSVLGQDYPRVETIVMDGGSTDGSVDVIRSYEKRLAYWVSEKDAGQADAINKGMARARGEIVAWLNSDDYYLPGAVRAALRAFERNPDALLVYGNMLAVDERGQTINSFRFKQLTFEDLLSFQIIGQPAVFMRRAAFERAGGLDLSYHFLLDHHLWIRIAAQGRILHVPQTWAAARYHAEAKNRARASEFGSEAFRILNEVERDANLASAFANIKRRARASAHRVDARYLLDGDRPSASLAAWTRAFFIYPPVALARLNLLGSALLNLVGLGKLREATLEKRKSRFSRAKDVK
ncbi:MAG: glycosyltransferase family 2 protein [Anaerolineales bacterium]|jgi:glycosyltransferase involved in cell wall biosynthesis|nr:glycosyltransferase family 2 protein [Anaerolineales bacterium]GER79044.1 glycosyltransferase [Candidatus Denitrolinea symbiosum]